MTDRVFSLNVVLKENVRIDDVECLQQAIMLMKNVVSVGVNIADAESYMAEERAKNQLKLKLYEVLK